MFFCKRACEKLFYLQGSLCLSRKLPPVYHTGGRRTRICSYKMRLCNCSCLLSRHWNLFTGSGVESLLIVFPYLVTFQKRLFLSLFLLVEGMDEIFLIPYLVSSNLRGAGDSLQPPLPLVRLHNSVFCFFCCLARQRASFLFSSAPQHSTDNFGASGTVIILIFMLSWIPDLSGSA